jgi:hypothetical protein
MKTKGTFDVLHGGSPRARVHTDGSSDIARLGDRISPQPDGCWIWTGYLDERGYGHVLVDGKWQLAHRAVYVILRSPLTPLRVLHHECHQPSCCNPDHLTPMTPSQHSQLHADLREGHGRR